MTNAAPKPTETRPAKATAPQSESTPAAPETSVFLRDGRRLRTSDSDDPSVAWTAQGGTPKPVDVPEPGYIFTRAQLPDPDAQRTVSVDPVAWAQIGRVEVREDDGSVTSLGV